MASNKDYLEYILELLSDLDDISYRAMMGEYIIYYRGKVVGGIYDNRFLIKPVKTALAMMPDADLELPYEGAKEMLLVDDVENREFLRELLETMYGELPAQKKKPPLPLAAWLSPTRSLPKCCPSIDVHSFKKRLTNRRKSVTI